ncbi:hypothetical protein PsorP6_008215 [Peronosclerospora sorghi]|uniref:Uncharacterized protein n=1 Tax=Peronosclerospora sorghi TaxID=230839 RepID=A0ACC0W7C0_9STRA|nr:hypothetical protein PsorP6_008215 [Peronosclerospora sorghi]
MGNQVSAAATDPGHDAQEMASKECPLKRDAMKIEECSMHRNQARSVADVMASGCPVVRDGKEDQEIYNVYGQRIDPSNMMPYNPNQEPNEEQHYPLPQYRVQSTIPKGGTEGTWLYPSEQMFYNALKRKNKGEDVHEGDVRAIVSIHNNMNERAWAQVEHYERVCHPDLDGSKLLKFCGRPDKLTPIAWIKRMLGYGTPFDRHDWTVLRSDNTQVRYVIDYYFNDEKSAADEIPELHSADKVKSISMYARPAVDSMGALVDRIKYPVVSLMNGLKGPDVTARSALVERSQEEKNTVESLSVEEVENTFSKVKDKCKGCMQEIKTCRNESQCSQAALALQLCMGRIICPKEAAAFSKALEGGNETAVETAFLAMNSSLEQFEAQGASAMHELAVREALGQKA